MPLGESFEPQSPLNDCPQLLKTPSTTTIARESSGLELLSRTSTEIIDDLEEPSRTKERPTPGETSFNLSLPVSSVSEVIDLTEEQLEELGNKDYSVSRVSKSRILVDKARDRNTTEDVLVSLTSGLPTFMPTLHHIQGEFRILKLKKEHSVTVACEYNSHLASGTLTYVTIDKTTADVHSFRKGAV